MAKTSTLTKSSSKTFDIILSAMLITLVFVATLFLNIRLPIAANGGLVHLGTAMLFIISIVFGPKKGALAGAFGMALFDLFSGWTLWAPFTFIARGLQGYVVGKILMVFQSSREECRLQYFSHYCFCTCNVGRVLCLRSHFI